MTKTLQFICNELLSSRHLTEEPGNKFQGNCLVTKLQMFHKHSNKFCTENEPKCYMGLTLLSEGLIGFWLCKSLDSLLPISRWITEKPFLILIPFRFLRATASKYGESDDSSENSDFLLLRQKDPFGELFSEIYFQSFSKFTFL